MSAAEIGDEKEEVGLTLLGRGSVWQLLGEY
jgi:hypothetical protein